MNDRVSGLCELGGHRRLPLQLIATLDESRLRTARRSRCGRLLGPIATRVLRHPHAHLSRCHYQSNCQQIAPRKYLHNHTSLPTALKMPQKRLSFKLFAGKGGFGLGTGGASVPACATSTFTEWRLGDCRLAIPTSDGGKRDVRPTRRLWRITEKRSKPSRTGKCFFQSPND